MTHGCSDKIVASAASLTLLFGSASVAAAADADEAAATPDTPGAAVEALLAHIPESHRDACQPDLGDLWPEPEEGSVTMSVRCELDDGLEVSYTQFASTDALTDRYQQWLESLPEAVHGVSDCSDSDSDEGSYTIGGEPAGRLLCYKEYDSTTLHWTHEPTNIYGEASQQVAPEALRAWWKAESGPLETAADSPETGLGAALDALLAQVPENHRATCVSSGGDPAEGYVMSLWCEVSPELDVSYSQFESLEALEAAYQISLDSREVERSSGDCSQTWPGEGPYDIGGEPAGRLFCGDWYSLGQIQLTWTHEPTLIGVTAFSEGDRADLLKWWHEASGPVG